MPAALCRRWTRVLLLQQLLVEVFDLLDPDLYAFFTFVVC